MLRTPDKLTSLWAQIGFCTSLGFILPAASVVGFAIGYALDGWLHTKPVLAIVMGFLGGAGGFVEVLRILSKAEKDAGGNNSDPGTGPS